MIQKDMSLNKLGWFLFLIMVIGVTGQKTYEWIDDKYSSARKAQLMVYTMVYRPAISESLQEFYRIYKRWPGSMEEVVLKNLLPEWSEIYLPVSVARKDLKHPSYKDKNYIYSSQVGAVASFEIAPYLLIKKGNDMIIRIKFDDDPSLFKDMIVLPPTSAG